MDSIATLEMLSFFRGFLHDMLLYLVILAIFVFAFWSVLQILAPIKALTVFYADPSQPSQKQPFRFLDLPPEVRNIVYDHHFARYRTEYWNIRRGKKTPPDAILNVNRQVYEEAAHALYSKTSISIIIRNVASLHGDKRPFAGVIRRAPNALEYVPTVHLEIRWPGSGLSNKCKKHDRHGRSFKELQANTMTVCDALAKLPNLRTIKVHFFEEKSPGSWKPRLQARGRIVGYLKPLRVIRYANPGIVIEMPQDCPISTAGLAKQQRWCPFQHVDLVELDEEYEEEIRRSTDEDLCLRKR